MATMNISIPDEMKEWVEAQCKDGSYANNSDVVRDLIRRDQRRIAAIERLNLLIDEGIRSGFVEDYDAESHRRNLREKYRIEQAEDA